MNFSGGDHSRSCWSGVRNCAEKREINQGTYARCTHIKNKEKLSRISLNTHTLMKTPLEKKVAGSESRENRQNYCTRNLLRTYYSISGDLKRVLRGNLNSAVSAVTKPHRQVRYPL